MLNTIMFSIQTGSVTVLCQATLGPEAKGKICTTTDLELEELENISKHCHSLALCPRVWGKGRYPLRHGLEVFPGLGSSYKLLWPWLQGKPREVCPAASPNPGRSEFRVGTGPTRGETENMGTHCSWLQGSCYVPLASWLEIHSFSMLWGLLPDVLWCALLLDF